MGVVSQKPHVKAGCSPCHRATDSPISKNAQGLSEDIRAPGGFPFALAHRCVADVYLASEAQEKRESEISHSFIQQPGRVSDDNALHSGRWNFDGIVPDPPT